MSFYKIPMVPGPVSISPAALPFLAADYGAGFMEDDFYCLYTGVTDKLRLFMGTGNDVIIQSGEAMATLWGAMKSTIEPGDSVLCISTGLFGSGFADMAKTLKAEPHLVEYGADETINDLDRIEDSIRAYKPKIITVVHCETPSGTLNPLDGVGYLKKKYSCQLLIVDVVSSVACTPVKSDCWNADIVMGGSQKGLSLPPDLGFCSVSERAWDIINDVKYAGYEAYAPWYGLHDAAGFDITPNWNAIAALNAVLDDLIAEGIDNVYARHETVAEFCRSELVKLGYELFPANDAIPSPSVTAVKVPAETTFDEFNRRVRSYGMGIGQGFGKTDGSIFRLGHMGTQATMENARAAMEVLSRVR